MPCQAALADLLQRAGRPKDAARAYDRAQALHQRVERAYLDEQRAGLATD